MLRAKSKRLHKMSRRFLLFIIDVESKSRKGVRQEAHTQRGLSSFLKGLQKLNQIFFVGCRQKFPPLLQEDALIVTDV